MAKWTDRYANSEILEIQKYYNCCGFYGFNEFPPQKCQTQSGVPCVYALIKALKRPLRGLGVLFFSYGFSHLLSDFLFIIAYDPEDDPYAIMISKMRQ